MVSSDIIGEADSDTIQETWAGGTLGEVTQPSDIFSSGEATDGPEIDKSDGPTEIDTMFHYNSLNISPRLTVYGHCLLLDYFLLKFRVGDGAVEMETDDAVGPRD